MIQSRQSNYVLSILCDYNDAHILVKEIVTIVGLATEADENALASGATEDTKLQEQHVVIINL